MPNKPPELSVIPFAETLAESLPSSYLKMSDITKEQADAIAEDFRRWRLAKEWFEPRRIATTQIAKEKADFALRNYITSLEPAIYRDDMRRRLNILLRRK